MFVSISSPWLFRWEYLSDGSLRSLTININTFSLFSIYRIFFLPLSLSLSLIFRFHLRLACAQILAMHMGLGAGPSWSYVLYQLRRIIIINHNHHRRAMYLCFTAVVGGRFFCGRRPADLDSLVEPIRLRLWAVPERLCWRRRGARKKLKSAEHSAENIDAIHSLIIEKTQPTNGTVSHSAAQIHTSIQRRRLIRFTRNVTRAQIIIFANN